MAPAKNTGNPTVSVIMPFYNSAKHLHEAVSSILNQTFRDFELLLINDKSTDDSESLALSFDDSRIRLIENRGEKGRSAARNLGIDLSRGELIAVMDSDDISFPERLEKQVEFLKKNPGMAACGSAAIHTGVQYGWRWETVSAPERIASELLFQNCFVHSSIMFRKKTAMDRNIRYQPEMEPSEDYDLISRISEAGRVENLLTPLVGYRIYPGQVSWQISFEKTDNAVKKRQLEKLFPHVSPEDENTHHLLSARIPAVTKDEFRGVAVWAEKLLKANQEKNTYREAEFIETLKTKWFQYCLKNSKFGLFTLKSWNNSPLSDNAPLKCSQKIKFAINCLFKR